VWQVTESVATACDLLLEDAGVALWPGVHSKNSAILRSKYGARWDDFHVDRERMEEVGGIAMDVEVEVEIRSLARSTNPRHEANTSSSFLEALE
jgi:hypothetical protein